MTDADPAAFRNQATTVFRVVVACLCAAGIGIAALGWWLGGGWGLLVGGLLGLAIAGAGAAGAGLLYAMTQDGA